jgi:hypothetical protein
VNDDAGKIRVLAVEKREIIIVCGLINHQLYMLMQCQCPKLAGC